MDWLSGLATEFTYAVGDSQVWASIAEAVVLFIVCAAVGVWIARFVGLLDADAPAGEQLGVGLAAGLLVIAAWWAAIGSGGRSAFTPVAVGFAIALVLAVRDRLRRSVRRGAIADGSADAVEATAASARQRRGLVLATAGGAAFIIAFSFLYGSTMALSPRDGVQPVEFMDEGFYSVLAQDLATTGTETILPPSGFTDIPGTPTQNWYHWGEIWLASAVIRFLGVAPILARHFVVLPILLLAAAALSGTLVRRINRTQSAGAFLLGFASCIFLAPVPVLLGEFFSTWAVGLVFGISLYGLAAVAVLLSLVIFVRPRTDAVGPPFAVFVGSALAAILPAHIVMAALTCVGGTAVLGIRLVRARALRQRVAVIPAVWRPVLLVAGLGVVASVAWGLLTGHGVPGSGSSPGVAAFNESWSGPLMTVVVGAGAFYAIPAAWLIVRRDAPSHADLYIAAAIVVAVAAVVWGARLGDFNTFHVFFGAIAVVATPAAACALWVVLRRAKATRHRLVVVGLVVLVVMQLEIGVVLGTLRLQRFGPGNFEPVPLSVLAAMRALPKDARIAYSCEPLEEVSYWDARLLSIGVHADRRMVPMCFEADSFGPLVGAKRSLEMSPLFVTAPQLALFPDASAQPSPEEATAFLHAHRIGYIYADDAHPNRLVPGATVIAEIGQFRLLAVP